MRVLALSDAPRPAPFLLLGSILVGGCGGAVDIITPPPPPPTDFRIEFQPDAEDVATAIALGWGGAIPEVEVTLRPEDTARGGPQSFRGSAQGQLLLTGVAAGRYIVEGARWLTAPERARLSATDDALGFVATATVDVITGGIATLALPASRRRSLVISEWAFNHKDEYHFGGFLELYNNSDSTVYLDGVIAGEGWWPSLETPPPLDRRTRQPTSGPAARRLAPSGTRERPR